MKRGKERPVVIKRRLLKSDAWLIFFIFVLNLLISNCRRSEKMFDLALINNGRVVDDNGNPRFQAGPGNRKIYTFFSLGYCNLKIRC